MVTSTLRTSQLVALVSVATAVVLLVAGLQRFKGAQLMVPLQVSNLKNWMLPELILWWMNCPQVRPIANLFRPLPP